MTEQNTLLIFQLLAAFQVKHFLADYPFQGAYMLKKTRADWGFFIPLSAHCFVHALGSALIIIFIQPQLLWLAACDFVIHFIMDRIKSGPKYLGRFNDESKASFWNCFGFDQMVHHFTHYGIIFLLVS